jgi:ABC-2 type transport system ATP-binding protein
MPLPARRGARVRRANLDDMTNTIVVTDRLTKRYGHRLAVDDVSLTVRSGEVYGFLGPNGAGKTTTLRMLLGLVRPTAGSATVLGHAPGNPGAVARIGALVEGPGFYPYLAGRDNLRVMARYQGVSDRDVETALERVDLADRGDDPFRSYSLGMKQRLGVASALLGPPDMLVLDEPTNGLDPAGMADMRRLIVDLAAQGQTVMLSSHLLSEVQEICDRVGVIANGRLLTESTVAELRGGSTVFLRAEPVERALAVSMQVAGYDAVTRLDDGLRLEMNTDRAPELARALVDAGAAIHEIRPSERSLEDVFFEMTSGDEDADLAEEVTP